MSKSYCGCTEHVEYRTLGNILVLDWRRSKSGIYIPFRQLFPTPLFACSYCVCRGLITRLSDKTESGDAVFPRTVTQLMTPQGSPHETWQRTLIYDLHQSLIEISLVLSEQFVDVLQLDQCVSKSRRLHAHTTQFHLKLGLRSFRPRQRLVCTSNTQSQTHFSTRHVHHASNQPVISSAFRFHTLTAFQSFNLLMPTVAGLTRSGTGSFISVPMWQH